MEFLINIIFFSTLTTVAVCLPYNSFVKGSKVEFESSGNGAGEPVQGIVKVVQLDPHTLAQSGLLRRGLTPRRSLSHSSRLPFPAFLSRSRLGSAHKEPVSPLQILHPKKPSEMELNKKQGLQMWQRAINKGSKMTLPVNLKDTKQTCNAVPFTQVKILIWLLTQLFFLQTLKHVLFLTWLNTFTCIFTHKSDCGSGGALFAQDSIAAVSWTCSS